MTLPSILRRALLWIRVRRLILIASTLASACGRLGFDPISDGGSELDGVTSDAGAIMVEVPRFSTGSATYVDVPGGILTIPASPGQTWAVFVAARLESTSFDEIAAEARYLVDGIEQGMGGTQNASVDRPGPWQHFYVLAGTQAPIVIQFQLRDLSGAIATIDQLQVVAVPLPASTDPLYASSDPIVTATLPTFAVLAPIATLTVSPASAGDYVVFLLATSTEAPGAQDIFTEWFDPAGVPWANDFLNPRQPWQTHLIVRRTTLAAGPSTIVLKALTRDTAQVRNVRVLALRTSGLASFDLAESTLFRSTTSAVPTTALTLTPGASAASAYLALATVRIEDDCANTLPAERRVQIDYAMTPTVLIDAGRHESANCAYETTYGTVRLLPERPMTISASYSSGNGQIVNHAESSLVLLGLR